MDFQINSGLFEYDREQIDDLLPNKPDFYKIYIDGSEYEWDLTDKMHLTGHFAKSEKEAIIYVLNRSGYRLAYIGDPLPLDDWKSAYMAYTIFQMNSIEDLIDAYYKTMAQALEILRASELYICDIAFEEIRGELLKFENAYNIQYIIRYYSMITDLAQRINSSYELIPHNTNRPNLVQEKPILRLRCDDHDPTTAVKIYDDANVYITNRNIVNDICEILIYRKDTDKVRFNILYESSDIYSDANVENQIKNAVTAYMNEETDAAYESALDAVKCMIRAFHYDIVSILGYFNICISVAHKLNNDYYISDVKETDDEDEDV